MLPQPNCSKTNNSQPIKASRVSFQSNMDEESRPNKKARFMDNRSSSRSGTSGLSKTVKELISSYVPVSHEKKAFYCRVCKYEGSSEEDLFEHRKSEDHKAAVAVERKASFCRLCRKQFTSPEQLKEHLKGKGHKLALENAMSRKQGRGLTKDGVKLEGI